MTLSSPSAFCVPSRWFPGMRTFPWTALRLAGMLPVAIVLVIHMLAYLTLTPGTLLPLLPTHPLQASVLLCIFHVVFFFTLANYLLLVFTDPGSVPPQWNAPPPSTFFVHPPPPPSLLPSTTPDPEPDEPEPEPEPLLPPPTRKSKSSTSSFRFAHLMHDRTYEGFLRYCRICNAYKPDRAHHCSVCRRCILRMDHHCIFVNNCVSFYNHKFFLAFIIYAFVGCLMVTILSFPTFADVISVHSVVRNLHPIAPAQPLVVAHHQALRLPIRVLRQVLSPLLSSSSRLDFSHYSAARSLSPFLRTTVLVGYISSTAFSFALSVFVILHVYLVSKGRTTIEMYEMTDPLRAPLVAQYDLGPRHNFKNVCGTVPFCWPFPTRAFIPGDGITYQRRNSPTHSPV